jgi:hypothetical protein
MDIRQEITKHLEWIERIASLLGNEDVTQEELHEITQHDKCALGQWLRSDASRKYRNLLEFQNLIDSHDEFHKLAGSFIAVFRQRNESEALKLEAQFIEMSKKVISYLHVLQEKAEEDAGDKK